MRALVRCAARNAIAAMMVKTPSTRDIGADGDANKTARQRSERASDDGSRGRAHRAVAQSLLRSRNAECRKDTDNNDRNANECAHDKRSSHVWSSRNCRDGGRFNAREHTTGFLHGYCVKRLAPCTPPAVSRALRYRPAPFDAVDVWRLWKSLLAPRL
jgi:hypothetical protein